MAAGLKEIAVCLKGARLAKSLTQQQLGKRAGLPQSHISKIEAGGVDLQLSSLAEIARALGLEIKLVPRNALAAVESAIRAQGLGTGHAAAALNVQTRLAQRIKSGFPDLPQADAFQSAIRDILPLEFDAAASKALDQALKPASKLWKLLDGKCSEAVLARRLEAATESLRQFRTLHSSSIESRRQIPAYRLEEEHD